MDPVSLQHQRDEFAAQFARIDTRKRKRLSIRWKALLVFVAVCVCILLSAAFEDWRARAEEGALTMHHVGAWRVKCFERDELVAFLERRFGETQAAGGYVSESRVIVLTTNPDDGSFSIVSENADGTACLVASGTLWTPVTPRQDDGEGA